MALLIEMVCIYISNSAAVFERSRAPREPCIVPDRLLHRIKVFSFRDHWHINQLLAYFISGGTRRCHVRYIFS